jgi:hypothetical protein
MHQEDENRRKALKPNPNADYVSIVVTRLWGLLVESCELLESYDGEPATPAASLNNHRLQFSFKNEFKWKRREIFDQIL